MSGALAPKAAFELTSLCDETNERWFRMVVDTRVCSKGAAVAPLYVFYKDTTVAVNSQLVTWVRRAGRVGKDGHADFSGVFHHSGLVSCFLFFVSFR